MFCKVRCSRSRSRVYLPALCRSREKRELLLDNFFRAPAISYFRSPEKGSPRKLWYFARKRSPRMFFQHRCRHPLLSVSSLSLSLSDPLLILPSFCDSNSFNHIFAMFHSSNFDHHQTTTTALAFYIIFLLFPTTSAGTLVPFPLAVRVAVHPPSRVPLSPVNQTSTRKRGQMYTTRGARRTGCPERSPAAIDFRRLDEIRVRRYVSRERMFRPLFLGLPLGHYIHLKPKYM